MALITTAGAANANSYADTAAATAYHAARGNAAWAAANSTNQEAALIRATEWLDGKYRRRWPGQKLNGRSQSLDWPRGYAYDSEDFYIDALTIPNEVVEATCEAALKELASPGSLSPSVTPGTAKVLTGVDTLSWTPLRASASASDMAPTLLAVDRALSGIIGGANNVTMVRS